MLEVNAQPNIISFHDYREYLRAFFNWKKATSPRFSHRKFAQLADIKSSNYLMLVMDKKRNLSEEKAHVVARAMKLKRVESDYFVLLVKAKTAKSEDARAHIVHDLQKSSRRIAARALPADKAEYLSSWYISLVRELIFLRDFEPRAKWITEKLDGLITPPQAESAIRILFSLGFWRKGANGKTEADDALVDTGPEAQTFANVSVTKIHRDTMTAWTKVLESKPKAERELGLLHIPIDSAKIPELKRRIQSFQDEIIGWLQDEKDADQLVQLGTYLIPVTKKGHPVG